MFEPVVIAVIFGAYLLAGTVKGIIGLGLPTVTLALLTIVIDLPTAIALILVPAFLTNVWQGLVGGFAFALVRRLWVFFLVATIATAFGTFAFSLVDLHWLAALLGVLLMAYSVVNLVGFHVLIRERPAAWIELSVATITGLLTGMTGSAVVPGVMYMQSLGMSRDMLIQAMGILFVLTTIALAVGLQRNQILTVELGMLSAAVLLPAVLGMVIGQKIRKRLSEARFRKVFFWSVLFLGGYILLRSLVQGT